MSIVSLLSPRRRKLAEAVGRMGFVHPFLTVAAALKADVKPQTALACLSCETGDGSNVFGCDWGPQNGQPPFCGDTVTVSRYRAMRRSGRQNGVGPTQLTSKELQDEADRRGGCARPYPNMVVGFRHLGKLIRAHGVEKGAARYNGGDSEIGERNGRAYGEKFARFRDQHERNLRRKGFKV